MGPSQQPPKDKKLKEEEPALLRRGGRTVPLVHRRGRFTVKLARGFQARDIPALRGATPAGKPHQQVQMFEAAPEEVDAIMGRLRDRTAGAGAGAEYTHHVYAVRDAALPAAGPDATTGQEVVLTDQILLQFKQGTRPEDVAKLLHDHALEILEEYTDRPLSFRVRVTDRSGGNPLKVSNRLAADGRVAYAEPNLLQRYRPAFEPASARFGRQWHLKNGGGVELTAGADVRAPQAWDITRGNRSVIVAVIDDGFDLDHPNFQGAGKVVSPTDFHQSSFGSAVSSDTDPRPEGSDYHGTPCAGVAVAEIGLGEVVGIAPDCALMPIRWPFVGTDSMVAAMFQHAVDRGASVISCSWGPGPGLHPLNSKVHQVLADAGTKGRGGKGCVICFAAGNDNIPLNAALGNGPKQGTHLAGEATHPNVIAVAASTSLDRKAAYSSWGREIAVCAPSNNFWPGSSGTKLPGRGIVTVDNGALGAGFDAGIYTERFGGTSSATPLVAGIAALVLAANPALTAAQVKQILQETAEKIVDHDPDPELSLQKGTYDADGHSDWFGHGRVNAHAAVQKARQLAVGGAPPVSVSLTSAPDLLIPDNRPAGSIDRIHVPNPGNVRQLDVGVEIAHTYIGDLRVRLLAPDGRAVVLHDRSGANTRNLAKSWSSATTAALAPLLGTPAQGTWTLEVTDLAPIDIGRLTRWSLQFELEPVSGLRLESAPGRAIPDNSVLGTADAITVPTDRTPARVEVELDITHSWIGDLRVTLQHPSGAQIVLQERTNPQDSSDNLRKTFTVADVAALGTFAGKPAKGAWILRVYDLAAIDTGKLNRWALKLS